MKRVMVARQDSNGKHDNKQEDQRRTWPPAVAKSIAGAVRKDVARLVAESRLKRSRCSDIQFLGRSDLEMNRWLGQGEFSEVAEVSFQKKTYAMKHLKSSLHSDYFYSAAVELAMEAHILGSMQHPNIVRLHGWTEKGVSAYAEGRHDSFFLLLECLDETLEERLVKWRKVEEQSRRRNSNVLQDVWQLFSTTTSDSYSRRSKSEPADGDENLSAEFEAPLGPEKQYLDKLCICLQIASALEYVHDKRIIYRDLKPDNVGFRRGQVKLFDFGMSREHPSLDISQPCQMTGLVGSMHYMSPEVALRKPYSPSTDVYSWAMVSYEILTLHKPFDEGWTKAQHLKLKKHAARPLLEGIDLSYALQKLLATAWHQSPSRRPTSARVCQDMRQFEEQYRFETLLKSTTSLSKKKKVVVLPENFHPEDTSADITEDMSSSDRSDPDAISVESFFMNATTV